VRHVLGFKMMLADRAGDFALAAPVVPRRPRDIEAAARDPGDHGRHHECDGECKESGQTLQLCAEQTGDRDQPGDRGAQHRADADRIDVVKMGALEFDSLRAQPSGLLITRSATRALTHATATME